MISHLHDFRHAHTYNRPTHTRNLWPHYVRELLNIFKEQRLQICVQEPVIYQGTDASLNIREASRKLWS